MIELSERLVDRGTPLLNFAFHSCALTDGLTPFHKTKEDVKKFEKKIFGFFEYVQKRGYQSATLGEAASEISAELASSGQQVSDKNTTREPSSDVQESRGETTLNRLEPVAALRNVA